MTDQGVQDVSIIACVDARGMCATRGGTRLPWSCREELLHFKRTTNNGVLVMGRRTLCELPRRLREQVDRPLVTLSRDTTTWPPGTTSYWATGPADALAVRDAHTPGLPLWVIGGPRTWDSFLAAGLVARCLVSRLRAAHATADVPWSPPSGWHCTPVQEHEEFVVEEWVP